MLGGAYLCYEGAEKVWEAVSGAKHSLAEVAAELNSEDHERKMVAGAVRTDFILSAEIMAIALAEVASEPFLTRAAILALVAVAITIGVYGAVRSEEHTSELQSLMRISYAVFCLKK